MSLRSRSAAWLALAGAAAVATALWDGSRGPGDVPRVPDPALSLDLVVSDPAAHRGRRVVARGRYDLGRSVFVAERGFEGRRGARVYTPLQIAGGAGAIALLVDRGWIPEDEVDGFADRDAAGDERTLYGTVQPARFGDPPAETAPPSTRRWRRLRPERLQAELPYPLLPLILTREAGSGVELPLAALGAGPPERSRWARLSVWLGCGALGAAAVALFLGRRRAAPDAAS